MNYLFLYIYSIFGTILKLRIFYIGKVPNFATCFILMGVSDKNKIDLTYYFTAQLHLLSVCVFVCVCVCVLGSKVSFITF